LSVAAGLLPADRLERVAGAPWVGVPMLEHMFAVTFRWSLVPAFAIVSICGALKSFGNLIMCEKVKDDEWKEHDGHSDHVGGALLISGASRHRQLPPWQ
jgi:xanthine permease XanP